MASSKKRETMTEVAFPPKAAFLFEPHRYKVMYGGRGSGKSHSAATALLVQGAKEKHRILCTREIQKSIKDSVHKLLCDKIDDIGLGSFYEPLETIIRGKNGTEFLFAGLANQTVSSIKSMEGCSKVWCEEAQTISKRSWDILIPTIRTEGSEIWVTFNPELDTDPTYERFVVNPPPSCVSVHMNYSDNPYFPEVLEQERLHCKLSNPEDYANIWEGQCRSAVEGAIYAAEVAASTSGNRICNVPYDPALKVHTVWDLGWNDSMSIILVQKLRSEIRVLEYIEDDHKTLDHYAALLNSKMYNWGHDWLPHDGKHKDFKTGKSTADILRKFGRKVRFTPNIPVESGIKAARMTFSQIYFDKVKAGRLVECLKRYRRSINVQTHEPGSPVHGPESHGSDCFRYLCLNTEKMHNEDELIESQMFEAFQPFSSSMGYIFAGLMIGGVMV
jgi:phage terminase large subunit